MYSRTVFEGQQLKPEHILLVKDKESPAQILANEVGVCRQTVKLFGGSCRRMSLWLQPDNLLDHHEQAETDELYQKVGKKWAESEPRRDTMLTSNAGA